MPPCPVGAEWVEIFKKSVKLKRVLKSVNSNFTMAGLSPKLEQAKTHFLSHHNVCYINRFAEFQTSDLWSNG